MNIDLKQLRTLLRVLEKRNVTEFEFEDEHGRIRLARGAGGARVVAYEERPEVAPGAPAPRPVEAARAESDEKCDFVTSPFVGTFYRSPSPEAPPFVEVGSAIRKGQALCIIEAMKLMNEIEADCDGTLVEILVENGKPVEFGQKLFKIRKA
ncbi:acetyl-CoA carboxylase biotin carboxyl carrier protein [Polyangium jinanense]|uniref:Biotin carboxyl carrier protein of acetyl-CoA carboxylase n=1 Tax=Polyangium jinanense TaxID=2829994 RepID=A0A9X3XGF4_9BACT|nr:acetyl-CoA carboxylase biotin carboxyl carrier protein [Polyangium jinanense]MDC3957749.1 acetyl-CoA carboxylase biotin carboxyl carrier protein [Polyangium jinanense]MDC3987541.1 acetyl-CoA carboxylase biotin carboxyl carrier protein [Polyangium jinanense]